MTYNPAVPYISMQCSVLKLILVFLPTILPSASHSIVCSHSRQLFSVEKALQIHCALPAQTKKTDRHRWWLAGEHSGELSSQKTRHIPSSGSLRQMTPNECLCCSMFAGCVHEQLFANKSNIKYSKVDNNVVFTGFAWCPKWPKKKKHLLKFRRKFIGNLGTEELWNKLKHRTYYCFIAILAFSCVSGHLKKVRTSKLPPPSAGFVPN